jgi:ABC-type oligopeptide transport system substrate-binding subunit
VHGAHFDEPMKAAYERYASSLYDERRAALEQGLETLWVERLPMLPLLLTSRLAAVRADLAGPRWGIADSLWWNVGEWHFEPAAEFH